MPGAAGDTRSSDSAAESDSGSESGSWASSSSAREPVYTPQEIGRLLLDFYKFLTTLHYRAEDLKVPPREGWQQITPEVCGHFRNDYAIEVLRHLPYMNSHSQLNYKCMLLDYTTFGPEHFDIAHRDNDHEEWWSTIGIVDAGWMVQLASGYESFGREVFLNVLDGEINEFDIGANDLGPVPLETWIEDMKDAYCRLLILPCPGRITWDCSDVPEYEDGRIPEVEVKVQTEDWPTKLDVQYVRQVYRDHGWPSGFQREAAFSCIYDLLRAMVGEENGNRDWPKAEPSNDPRYWIYARGCS